MYLLQEPHTFGHICDLGNTLDTYRVGAFPKAFILRYEWFHESMCVIHISGNNTSLYVVSLYIQCAGDIKQDLDSLNRVVEGAARMPFLTGMDAN